MIKLFMSCQQRLASREKIRWIPAFAGMTLIALTLPLASCGVKGKLKTPRQIEQEEAKAARAEEKKRAEEEKLKSESKVESNVESGEQK